uniref:FYVE-type domain-containing protein n=1 Tax=Chromera velia CCMP2878 TaxID=1169474 RepID=A0A0G4GEK6_9ALVE|eukprot:Cvel_21531.t1-p1 / transcript=Cvel_21531.t1 / gene=Cvel_21531 / organism=Chromera_velia_CCMP2878 / gene_product=1-phosphatidylinositol-3-phosphate 5-kinase FAB1B, putative / transcript_product=1-phosphatidylinositol-3-phosphate 5-kinase FAB1B, putative / location=Cvel_scaffold2028:9383-25443(+) / protein_length=3847 / sequence_SO=supercontig / SO=protein_coding / is_pseudo=false
MSGDRQACYTSFPRGGDHNSEDENQSTGSGSYPPASARHQQTTRPPQATSDGGGMFSWLSNLFQRSHDRPQGQGRQAPTPPAAPREAHPSRRAEAQQAPKTLPPNVHVQKNWMPDKKCKNCHQCSLPFTPFRRRHHCRMCGQIFCASCSSNFVPGKLIGESAPTRVCDYCLQLANLQDPLKPSGDSGRGAEGVLGGEWDSQAGSVGGDLDGLHGGRGNLRSGGALRRFSDSHHISTTSSLSRPRSVSGALSSSGGPGGGGGLPQTPQRGPPQLGGGPSVFRRSFGESDASMSMVGGADSSHSYSHTQETPPGMDVNRQRGFAGASSGLAGAFGSLGGPQGSGSPERSGKRQPAAGGGIFKVASDPALPHRSQQPHPKSRLLHDSGRHTPGVSSDAEADSHEEGNIPSGDTHTDADPSVDRVHQPASAPPCESVEHTSGYSLAVTPPPLPATAAVARDELAVMSEFDFEPLAPSRSQTTPSPSAAEATDGRPVSKLVPVEEEEGAGEIVMRTQRALELLSSAAYIHMEGSLACLCRLLGLPPEYERTIRDLALCCVENVLPPLSLDADLVVTKDEKDEQGGGREGGSSSFWRVVGLPSSSGGSGASQRSQVPVGALAGGLPPSVESSDRPTGGVGSSTLQVPGGQLGGKSASAKGGSWVGFLGSGQSGSSSAAGGGDGRVSGAKGDRTTKMDILENVKIKRVAGGKFEDSFYIDGVIFPGNVAHRKMPSCINNCALLLISNDIEFQRGQRKFVALDALMEQETEFVRIVSKKVRALDARLIICRRSVARLVQDALVALGVALMLNVPMKTMNRISRCTGAPILPSIDLAERAAASGLQVLGWCGGFRVVEKRKPQMEAIVVRRKKGHFKGLPLEVKIVEREAADAEGLQADRAMAIIEGCPPERGCTICLRGPPEAGVDPESPNGVLTRAKVALQWAIRLAFSLKCEMQLVSSSNGGVSPDVVLPMPHQIAPLPSHDFLPPSSSRSLPHPPEAFQKGGATPGVDVPEMPGPLSIATLLLRLRSAGVSSDSVVPVRLGVDHFVSLARENAEKLSNQREMGPGSVEGKEKETPAPPSRPTQILKPWQWIRWTAQSPLHALDLNSEGSLARLTSMVKLHDFVYASSSSAVPHQTAVEGGPVRASKKGGAGGEVSTSTGAASEGVVGGTTMNMNNMNNVDVSSGIGAPPGSTNPHINWLKLLQAGFQWKTGQGLPFQSFCVCVTDLTQCTEPTADCLVAFSDNDVTIAEYILSRCTQDPKRCPGSFMSPGSGGQTSKCRFPLMKHVMVFQHLNSRLVVSFAEQNATQAGVGEGAEFFSAGASSRAGVSADPSQQQGGHVRGSPAAMTPGASGGMLVSPSLAPSVATKAFRPPGQHPRHQGSSETRSALPSEAGFGSEPSSLEDIGDPEGGADEEEDIGGGSLDEIGNQNEWLNLNWGGALRGTQNGGAPSVSAASAASKRGDPSAALPTNGTSSSSSSTAAGAPSKNQKGEAGGREREKGLFGITTWQYCKICKKRVVGPVPLGTFGWGPGDIGLMSFAKFLELSLLNDTYVCLTGGCMHRLFRDQIRYFHHSASNLVIAMEWEHIPTYSLKSLQHQPLTNCCYPLTLPLTPSLPPLPPPLSIQQLLTMSGAMNDVMVRRVLQTRQKPSKWSALPVEIALPLPCRWDLSTLDLGPLAPSHTPPASFFQNAVIDSTAAVLMPLAEIQRRLFEGRDEALRGKTTLSLGRSGANEDSKESDRPPVPTPLGPLAKLGIDLDLVLPLFVPPPPARLTALEAHPSEFVALRKSAAETLGELISILNHLELLVCDFDVLSTCFLSRRRGTEAAAAAAELPTTLSVPQSAGLPAWRRRLGPPPVDSGLAEVSPSGAVRDLPSPTSISVGGPDISLRSQPLGGWNSNGEDQNNKLSSQQQQQQQTCLSAIHSLLKGLRDLRLRLTAVFGLLSARLVALKQFGGDSAALCILRSQLHQFAHQGRVTLQALLPLSVTAESGAKKSLTEGALPRCPDLNAIAEGRAGLGMLGRFQPPGLWPSVLARLFCQLVDSSGGARAYTESLNVPLSLQLKGAAATPVHRKESIPGPDKSPVPHATPASALISSHSTQQKQQQGAEREMAAHEASPSTSAVGGDALSGPERERGVEREKEKETAEETSSLFQPKDGLPRSKPEYRPTSSAESTKEKGVEGGVSVLQTAGSSNEAAAETLQAREGERASTPEDSDLEVPPLRRASLSSPPAAAAWSSSSSFAGAFKEGQTPLLAGQNKNVAGGGGEDPSAAVARPPEGSIPTSSPRPSSSPAHQAASLGGAADETDDSFSDLSACLEFELRESPAPAVGVVSSGEGGSGGVVTRGRVKEREARETVRKAQKGIQAIRAEQMIRSRQLLLAEESAASAPPLFPWGEGVLSSSLLPFPSPSSSNPLSTSEEGPHGSLGGLSRLRRAVSFFVLCTGEGDSPSWSDSDSVEVLEMGDGGDGDRNRERRRTRQSELTQDDEDEEAPLSPMMLRPALSKVKAGAVEGDDAVSSIADISSAAESRRCSDAQTSQQPLSKVPAERESVQTQQQILAAGANEDSQGGEAQEVEAERERRDDDLDIDDDVEVTVSINTALDKLLSSQLKAEAEGGAEVVSAAGGACAESIVCPERGIPADQIDVDCRSVNSGANLSVARMHSGGGMMTPTSAFSVSRTLLPPHGASSHTLLEASPVYSAHAGPPSDPDSSPFPPFSLRAPLGRSISSPSLLVRSDTHTHPFCPSHDSWAFASAASLLLLAESSSASPAHAHAQAVHTGPRSHSGRKWAQQTAPNGRAVPPRDGVSTRGHARTPSRDNREEIRHPSLASAAAAPLHPASQQADPKEDLGGAVEGRTLMNKRPSLHSEASFTSSAAAPSQQQQGEARGGAPMKREKEREASVSSSIPEKMETADEGDQSGVEANTAALNARFKPAAAGATSQSLPGGPSSSSPHPARDTGAGGGSVTQSLDRDRDEALFKEHVAAQAAKAETGSAGGVGTAADPLSVLRDYARRKGARGPESVSSVMSGTSSLRPPGQQPASSSTFSAAAALRIQTSPRQETNGLLSSSAVWTPGSVWLLRPCPTLYTPVSSLPIHPPPCAPAWTSAAAAAQTAPQEKSGKGKAQTQQQQQQAAASSSSSRAGGGPLPVPMAAGGGTATTVALPSLPPPPEILSRFPSSLFHLTNVLPPSLIDTAGGSAATRQQQQQNVMTVAEGPLAGLAVPAAAQREGSGLPSLLPGRKDKDKDKEGVKGAVESAGGAGDGKGGGVAPNSSSATQSVIAATFFSPQRALTAAINAAGTSFAQVLAGSGNETQPESLAVVRPENSLAAGSRAVSGGAESSLHAFSFPINPINILPPASPYLAAATQWVRGGLGGVVGGAGALPKKGAERSPITLGRRDATDAIPPVLRRDSGASSTQAASPNGGTNGGGEESQTMTTAAAVATAAACLGGDTKALGVAWHVAFSCVFSFCGPERTQERNHLGRGERNKKERTSRRERVKPAGSKDSIPIPSAAQIQEKAASLQGQNAPHENALAHDRTPQKEKERGKKEGEETNKNKDASPPQGPVSADLVPSSATSQVGSVSGPGSPKAKASNGPGLSPSPSCASLKSLPMPEAELTDPRENEKQEKAAKEKEKEKESTDDDPLLESTLTGSIPTTSVVVPVVPSRDDDRTLTGGGGLSPMPAAAELVKVAAGAETYVEGKVELEQKTKKKQKEGQVESKPENRSRALVVGARGGERENVIPLSKHFGRLEGETPVLPLSLRPLLTSLSLMSLQRWAAVTKRLQSANGPRAAVSLGHLPDCVGRLEVQVEEGDIGSVIAFCLLCAPLWDHMGTFWKATSGRTACLHGGFPFP